MVHKLGNTSILAFETQGGQNRKTPLKTVFGFSLMVRDHEKSEPEKVQVGTCQDLTGSKRMDQMDQNQFFTSIKLYSRFVSTKGSTLAVGSTTTLQGIQCHVTWLDQD